MTASLFASYDSAPQLLADTTSRNSVMSMDLPLQSLDGLLGEELKSTSPRDNNDNQNNNSDEYTLDLKPPSPVLPSNNKVTRSDSDAARFMDKMKAILKATTPTAAAQVVNSCLPPMPMVGRKRTLSEMTADSGAWGDDLTSSVDQLINYSDVFRTQESVAAQNEKPAAKKTKPAAIVAAAAAAPAPAATTERVYVIPTENDVLCGKGGRSNNNPANQRYLKLKDNMQERYIRAEKNEKKSISQELVDTVNKQWKGRFLKKEPTAPERWYELDNEAARKKCSQALREINTAEKRAEKRAKYAK